MDSSKQIAHLGFIQGVINRLGSNSFLLKGWSITLVAACFALATKDAEKKFLLLAYFPVFMFWVLDGYFLYQERLYRKLYEGVASGEIPSSLFVMSTDGVVNQTPSLLAALYSRTLLIFHGCIVFLVSVAVYLYLVRI